MKATYPIQDKAKLKELMSVYPVGSKNRLLLEFALRTGLRIGDILSFQVKDVYKEQYFWVTEQKTGKKKMVSLHPSLKQSVEQYVDLEQLKADDYILYSHKTKTKPIQRMQAHRIITFAGDQIGIQPLSAHSLRKTFGFWSYKQGVDISLLQTIFQHSTQAVTLRYIGITQERINTVYETVDMGF